MNPHIQPPLHAPMLQITPLKQTYVHSITRLNLSKRQTLYSVLDHLQLEVTQVKLDFSADVFKQNDHPTEKKRNYLKSRLGNTFNGACRSAVPVPSMDIGGGQR